MKLLNTKLTTVKMKSHIIEAQVPTVNTCQHLYSAWLALFSGVGFLIFT